MVFFATLLVVIYSLAFPQNDKAVRGAVPGMLWVALVFTGTIALTAHRSRARNDTMRRAAAAGAAARGVSRQGGRDDGARAGRCDCGAARAVAQRADVRPHRQAGAGRRARRDRHLDRRSVFAATLLKVRSRDVLLPVILYPLLVPLFFAGAKITAASSPRSQSDAASY
jgi:heme exporter protein B